MKFYETVFILDAAPEAIEGEIQKVVDLISANKGQLISLDRWGMRKLAYEIKRRGQAYYTCLYFNGDESLPAKLENLFKLNEHCLRYLTILSAHTAEEIAARGQKAEPKAAAPTPAAPKAVEKKAAVGIGLGAKQHPEAPQEDKESEALEEQTEESSVEEMTPADQPAKEPQEISPEPEESEMPEKKPPESEGVREEPADAEQEGSEELPESEESEEIAEEQEGDKKEREESPPPSDS